MGERVEVFGLEEGRAGALIPCGAWFRSGIRFNFFLSRWPAGSINSSGTSSTICRRKTASYGSSWDLGGFGSPTISEFG
jgi:hypothetical protein